MSMVFLIAARTASNRYESTAPGWSIKPAVWIIWVGTITCRVSGSRIIVIRRGGRGRCRANDGTRRDTGGDTAPTVPTATVIPAAGNIDVAVYVGGVDVGTVEVTGVDAAVACGDPGPVAARGGGTAIVPPPGHAGTVEASGAAARASGITAAGAHPTATAPHPTTAAPHPTAAAATATLR